MTKVDIFSGFLGAGKTTLIKKLIAEAFKGENIVIIENEFGDIGIDGGFLKDAGINITEMNSGCICCSLVGDFGKALVKVIDEYHPERILIEPSGVGKLSDVIRAVRDVDSDELVLNSFTTVADAGKCKMYMKNFGEFFNNQIENAGTVVLSHTKNIAEAKLAAVIDMIREHNAGCEIVTTDWDEISGEQILSAMEHASTLEAELEKLRDEEVCPECGGHHHHHHHHDHDGHDDDECHCHGHHHDDDDDDDDEDEHEHHHHDGDHCDCGCEHDHGHHHHHADEVFTSWGHESAHRYTEEKLKSAVCALENENEYGMVLRAKGIVPGDGCWYHFDYTPGDCDVRTGSAGTTGRLCVIGSKINEEKLAELFK